MIRFVGRRILGAVGVLVVASVVIFGLMHLAPGDPASVLAGPDASTETVEAIRNDLGLNEPIVAQYLSWVGGLLTGDLGESYIFHRPNTELILDRAGSTVQLTMSATVMMVALGAAMGVALATSRSRLVRQVIDFLATLALALPPFVSGVILIFAFAVTWQFLPSGGDAPFLSDPGESLKRMFLPGLAMALPGAPVIARLLSTQLKRSMQEEFVLTAVAKGASPRWITWRHAVPNSLGPAVIELGIRIGHLLGGAIVAEAIFARSGLGGLLVQSVQARDYLLAQALLLLAIAVAIVLQLIAELVIARMDPRIRLEAAV